MTNLFSSLGKKGVSFLTLLSMVATISMPFVLYPASVVAAPPVSTITIVTSVSGNTVNASGTTHATSADIASHWSVSVDWGDGTPLVANISITLTDNKNGTWEASHTYVSGGTYIITAFLYKSGTAEALNSDSASVVIVDTLPPTVTIDSVAPNPTNAGTTVTWHANENGTYSVHVGGTDCLTGTSVENGSYSTTPSIVATAILTGSLAEGFNTLRVCVTDAATNVGDSTSLVTKDSIAPVIDGHADINDIEATSSAGATVTYTAPNAVDIVDGVQSAVCSPASGSTFPLGTTLVTCNKTDAAGNVATPTTFNVMVVDTTAPVVAQVSDIAIDAVSSFGATVTFTIPTATDFVDGSVAVTCNPDSGSTFPIGNTVVTCSATDSHSNTGTSQFQVNVQDNTPSLFIPGNITGVEATSLSGSTVTFSTSATDVEDGSIPVICTPASGSTFALGTTTVNCSATDLANNTTNGNFSVTVIDTTTPTIVLNGSADLTFEVGGAPYVDDGAVAHDNYDADVNVSTPDAVDINTVGDYVLHYNHTDANSNAAPEVLRTVHVAAHDTTPDQFTFVDKTNVPLNTVIESAPVTITGISTEVPISVTGGEYSINDGTFASSAGTVNNNDIVKVHHTSSSTNNTSVDTVLTVSTISDTFTSTTLSLTHTLTYTAGANGAITGTSPQIVDDGGNGSAVTAVADSGFHFVDWSDISTANPRTDTNVTSDISVTANFSADLTPTPTPTPTPTSGGGGGGGCSSCLLGGSSQLYTITSSANAGGSIAQSGTVTVSSGSTQGFAITANANFQVADVLVDGVSVGPVNSYMFSNITANHTITASFSGVLGTQTTSQETSTGGEGNTGAPRSLIKGAGAVNNGGITPTLSPEASPTPEANQTAALSEAGGWGGFLHWLWQNLWWIILLLVLYAIYRWYTSENKSNTK